MADADKRIDQLDEATSISDNDLLVLESSSDQKAKNLKGVTLKNYVYNAVYDSVTLAIQSDIEDLEESLEGYAEAAAQAASDAADILDDVEAAGTQAVSDIGTAKTSAISDINSTKTTAIDAIASEKTEALAEIDGAVEQVESYAYDIEGLKELQNEKTVTGTEITVEDAAPLNAKKVLLTLKPKQDFNGYDKPWPAGGNVNKFDKATANEGKKLDATGGLLDNSSRFVSDYIAVTENADYYLTKVTGASSGYTCSVYDSNKSFLRFFQLSGSSGVSGTINVGAGAAYVRFESLSTYIDESMFSAGTTAPDKYYSYSNICPIIGHTEAKITRTGKNLLKVTATTQSANGLTFTVNSDGSVRVNGTSTAETNFYLSLTTSLPVGSYILNGCTGGHANTFLIYIDVPYQAADTGSGATFSVSDSSQLVKVRIVVRNSITLDKTFYPMIRLASETDATFAPYNSQVIVENICINQWDEVLEDGAYNSMGEKQAAAGYKRSANLIPVTPNTDYFLKVPTTYTNFRVCRYDINGTGLNRVAPSYNAVFNTGDGVYFISFHVETTTYNHDISINYPASFTDYYPYTGNGVAYSGTIDLGTGKMVLDKKMIDGGEMAWEYSSTYATFWSQVSDSVIPVRNVTKGILSSSYRTETAKQFNNSGWGSAPNGSVGFSTSSVPRICVKDSRYTDASTFRTAISGTQFLYDLATPITVQLTPQQLELLEGLNNIYTDADDMELLYCTSKMASLL